jgi:hypothetical protein
MRHGCVDGVEADASRDTVTACGERSPSVRSGILWPSFQELPRQQAIWADDPQRTDGRRQGSDRAAGKRPSASGS